MKRTPLIGLSVLAVAAALIATPLAAGATTGVPDPPTSVIAVAGPTSATVSWTPAATGAPATWYRIKATPSMPIPASCGHATSPSCAFTGLTNGTAYSFVVIAHNAVGVSTASTPSASVTPLDHPSAPTAVTTTVVGTSNGGGDIKVQWQAPLLNGGSPVTGYSVTSSPVVTPPALCTNTLLLKCAFTGLTNGVTYTFSVTATNAKGAGPAANAVGTPAKLFAGGLSSNWSGYISASSTPVTEVSGSWVVPTLNCNNVKANGEKDTASWVGIGGAGNVNGVNTGNLLQTGTADFCIGAQQYDYVWTELLPAAESPFEDNNFLPQPGDHMTGKVWFNGTAWETDITDAELQLEGTFIVGTSFQVIDLSGIIPPKSFPGLNPNTPSSYNGGKSAEWIMEDPMGYTGLLPFPNFESVSFSGLEVNLAQPTLADTDGVGLVNAKGLLLSAPGSFDNVANSFTCTYKPKGLLPGPFAAALIPWGASVLGTPAPLRTPSIQRSSLFRAS